MRRNDREIVDSRAIETFLSTQQVIRVGFYDKGEIFIVPVNFGYIYENGRLRIYFHGARAGRKYELAKAAPSVGFELDEAFGIRRAETVCAHSFLYQSIIGSGRLHLTENREEKRLGLSCVMQQVAGRDEWSFDDAMLDAVAVFRLDVERFSCKANQQREKA